MHVVGKIDGIAFVYFDERDVVRHKLVQAIVKAYESYGDGAQGTPPSRLTAAMPNCSATPPESQPRGGWRSPSPLLTAAVLADARARPLAGEGRARPRAATSPSRWSATAGCARSIARFAARTTRPMCCRFLATCRARVSTRQRLAADGGAARRRCGTGRRRGADRGRTSAISATSSSRRASPSGRPTKPAIRSRTELRVLALHGLLHLLGYDHEADDGRMARTESRLRRDGRARKTGLIARASARDDAAPAVPARPGRPCTSARSRPRSAR